MEKLKAGFKRGAKHNKDGIQATVTNVERKGGGNQVTLNISDDRGQNGNVQMRFWGPNKKTKECTVQVDKIKSEDAKFVKLFAETFVKYALDELMKGNTIKNVFKDKADFLSLKKAAKYFPCNQCDKTFLENRTLKCHMPRMHTGTIIK